jgi:hypothetical protein
MPNLSDDSEEGISLFPMFNILACTLGVMVFVLATVATVSLGADKAVRLTVDSEQDPTWVEWDGHSMVVHPQLDSVAFERDLRSIATFDQTYRYMFETLAGTRVGATLADVGLSSDGYIILLVRPSGFGNLPEVRGYLNLMGVEVVEEPIEQDWRRLQVR